MALRTCGSGLPFLIVGMVVACGDSSGEVKRPLDPPGRGTEVFYDLRLLDGDTAEARVRFVGEAPFNGGTWEQYEVSYPKPEGTKVVHLYGVQSEGRKVVVAGGEVRYPPGDTRHKDYVVTLDEPVAIDLDAVPLGEVQTTAVSGTLQVSGQPAIRASGTATWTRVRTDAVAETRLGTVGGVEIIEGEATLTGGEGHSLLDLLKGVTVHGTAWLHPTMGLLKVETPDFPIGAALTGSRDCGDPLSGDWNTIQAVAMVSKADPPFELDTSDCSGAWDADKNRHAKMLLELRYADEDRARTSAEPPVAVTFGTAWGWFPYTLIASPASIFHPEENGQGYTYWYALVDEAAKNEPGDNGILYRIEVRPTDALGAPVRVSARIHYGLYRP